ncbi:MAG: DegV family protein [Chloroflexi bacterium]|nr:MAG: DegV family protein [Chloroflexota bacterium]
MSKIAILTDTSATMPKSLMAQHNIHTVPHNIQWGEDSYLDSVNLQTSDFYERLAKDPVIPTTAQITMPTFMEAYEKLAVDHDAILVILISSGISGTIQGAQSAAAEFDKVPVEIIDSESTTGGLALVTLAAAEAVENGATLEEAAAVARKVAENLHVYFVVDTLKYLHRGGRIGGASRYLGTMLSIKPILTMAHKIDAVDRARGKKKAMKQLVSIVADKVQGQSVRAAIFHANVPETAVSVLNLCKEAMQIEQDITLELSPVIGTHVGAGTVGIACYPISCLD